MIAGPFDIYSVPLCGGAQPLPYQLFQLCATFALTLQSLALDDRLESIRKMDIETSSKRDIKNHVLFEIATEVANRGK